MPNRMLRWFRFGQLPPGPIRQTSEACAALAKHMDDDLEEGPEKTAGMRKLLEAKDCFVRQRIADVNHDADDDDA